MDAMCYPMHAVLVLMALPAEGDAKGVPCSCCGHEVSVSWGPLWQFIRSAHSKWYSVPLAVCSSLHRGYGDSDHPLDMEGYTIDNLVKDITELVRNGERGYLCVSCSCLSNFVHACRGYKVLHNQWVANVPPWLRLGRHSILLPMLLSAADSCLGLHQVHSGGPRLGRSDRLVSTGNGRGGFHSYSGYTDAQCLPVLPLALYTTVSPGMSCSYIVCWGTDVHTYACRWRCCTWAYIRCPYRMTGTMSVRTCRHSNRVLCTGVYRWIFNGMVLSNENCHHHLSPGHVVVSTIYTCTGCLGVAGRSAIATT